MTDWRMMIEYARSANERIAELVGLVTRPPDGTDALVIQDQRAVPLSARPKAKWYAKPRKASEVKAVCLHITAVSGGFGARKSDVRRHVAKGRSEVDAVVWAQADRFLATPYHAISARAIVRNLPGEVVSWHGNGCNRYALGYAIDMGASDDWDEAREVVRFESVLAAWVSEYPNLRHIEAHRQHSASRGNDPSARVFRPLAAAARGLGVFVRQGHTTGSGKPLPGSWLPY